MPFCTNCGKPLVKGVNKCGWCEHHLTEEEIEYLKTPIKNDVFVTTSIKRVVAIIQLLVGWQLLYIGSLICYYIFAPWGAELGRKHNRNPDYGFFYGGVFALLGLFFYWIYICLTKDPESYID